MGAYEIAEGDTYERVTEAFADLGISVFNGMITSIAASIPLFFCQLQFFKKFGTFLCLVIAFSWLFANFIFMSVLAQLKIPIESNEKCSNLRKDPNDLDHMHRSGSDDGSFCQVDDDQNCVTV